ncbi:hypothetical protein PT2222_80074 [Paraburkholderia tropica]
MRRARRIHLNSSAQQKNPAKTAIYRKSNKSHAPARRPTRGPSSPTAPPINSYIRHKTFDDRRHSD